MDQQNTSGVREPAQPQSGPAEQLLSFKFPEDPTWWETEGGIAKFAEAIELLSLSEEGEGLRRELLKNLESSGAMGIKEAGSDKVPDDLKKLRQTRSLLNWLCRSYPKPVKESAKKFGLPVDKGQDELTKATTKFQGKILRFRELLQKVSPNIIGTDYSSRLKDQLNRFRQSILGRFQFLQAEIRRLRAEIVDLSGREAAPPPAPGGTTPQPEPVEEPKPKVNQALWKRVCEKSDRTCPVTEHSMLKITYGGVELDVSAGGVWFDYGELRKILGADDESRIFLNTTRQDNPVFTGNPYLQTLRHFSDQKENRHEEIEKIGRDFDKALAGALKTSSSAKGDRITVILKLLQDLHQRREKLETQGYQFIEPEDYPRGYNKPPPDGLGPSASPSGGKPGGGGLGGATSGSQSSSPPPAGGGGGSGLGAATSGLPPSGGTGIGGASGSTPSGGSGSSIPGSPSYNPNAPKPPSPANSNDEKKDSSSGTDSKL